MSASPERTEHFNQLTPAEAERLAMLAEECGKVIQAVGKILRHGYGSFHPDRPEITNRTLLEREVRDLQAVLSLMDSDIDTILSEGQDLDRAATRKLRFSHHQDEHGLRNMEAGL